MPETTARIKPSKLIDCAGTYAMAATSDDGGDRRMIMWTAASLEIGPLGVLSWLYDLGLVRLVDGKFWAYDHARDDYVLYSSQRGPGWWSKVWFEIWGEQDH